MILPFATANGKERREGGFPQTVRGAVPRSVNIPVEEAKKKNKINKRNSLLK